MIRLLLVIAVLWFWAGVTIGVHLQSRVCYATADLPWLACQGYRR